MKTSPEIRLDILIKKEEGHYSAHCLQFDLVTTEGTLEDVQKAILDLCIAHIQFSYEHDNMEYLFHPAPQEYWTECFASFFKDPSCLIQVKELHFSLPGKISTKPLPAFMAQELLCNVPSACLCRGWHGRQEANPPSKLLPSPEQIEKLLEDVS